MDRPGGKLVTDSERGVAWIASGVQAWYVGTRAGAGCRMGSLGSERAGLQVGTPWVSERRGGRRQGLRAATVSGGPGGPAGLVEQAGVERLREALSQPPAQVLPTCTPRKASSPSKWKQTLPCFLGCFLSLEAVSFLCSK